MIIFEWNQKPITYSFFPNVPLGYRIVEKAPSLLFLPVNCITLKRLESDRLTDQNRKKHKYKMGVNYV